jgi:drug/metabolite transporter (DMT)-like permease
MWGYRAEQWGYLLALAVVPQLLGHTLILLAVRQGSASRASLSILLEPVGTIALAWVLMGERLGVYQMAGVSLTLIGLLMIAKQPGGDASPPEG